MEEFEQWLLDLEVQTLTDELKAEILEKLEEASQNLVTESYQEGYGAAKDDIVYHIENQM